MNHKYLQVTGLLACVLTHGTQAVAADDLKSAFKEGKVNGALRSYYNHRDFETSENTSAFASGGNIHVETAPLEGISVGATFYVSDDLNTRSDNPAKDNPNLPENVNILGEAYVQYETASDLLRIGRQLINTPFANPGDAFIIPVTYEAVSYVKKTAMGLTLSGHFLDRIKGRPDSAFVDTSAFSAGRYRVSDAPNEGVWVAGANYQNNQTALQAWGYHLPDQFNLAYLQADQSLQESFGVIPRFSAQYLHQRDDGAAVLGQVDTQTVGLKVAGSMGVTTAYLAWNHVEENAGAFNNGGILAPFNFSTSPIFTNSMIQTMENSTPGSAYKVGVDVNVTKNLGVALSHSVYNRIGAVDTDATDFDVTYKFAGSFDGLSLRLRVAMVSADVPAAEVIEVRPQIQYVF